MNDIECQGKITQKDFMKFNVHHLKKRISIIFLLLWGAAFFALRVVNTYLFFPFGIILLILASFAMSVCSTGVVILFLYYQLRREYKKDTLIKKLYTYSINEHKINQQREGGVSEYFWNDIYKAFKRSDMFLIYFSTNKAIILPFHFFESQKDIQKVEKVMNFHHKK